jgi:hypothetical protein
MRRAAEQLAASKPGLAAVATLEGLARTSTASDGANSAFLQALHLAEIDQSFGPHLSTLLHQEKMVNAPTGNLNSAACSVWASVVEVRMRAGPARARAFKEVMPKGLDAIAIITAVNLSKLTLELLCGGKKLQPAEVRMAAARAWPVLVAIARECHPRAAADVELGLLRMASDAFDRAECGETTVKAIEPVFAEMARLTDVYSTAGGELPSWSAARAATTLKGSEAAKLDEYFATVTKPKQPSGSVFGLGGDAAAYAKQQQLAAAETAKAAAATKLAAEKKAAADAAAKAATK